MVAGELDGEVLVSLLSLVNLESCLSGPDLLNYVILNEPFITALSAHVSNSGILYHQSVCLLRSMPICVYVSLAKVIYIADCCFWLCACFVLFYYFGFCPWS